MSTSTLFTAADSRVPGATHVLLLTTGSVASIKAPLIAAALLEVSAAQRNPSSVSERTQLRF